MTLPFRPSRATLIAVATAAALLLVLLVAGMAIAVAWRIAAAMIAALFLAIAGDYLLSKRRWQLATPTMTRRLPTAFAIGVRKEVTLSLSLSENATGWRCRLYDHVDATLQTTGLPMDVTLVPGSIVDVTYFVVPRRRGLVRFDAAHVHLMSRWRLCELLLRIGETDTRRVYPDFAQIARYAWLAGDRRLQEIGIKTYHQRGEGTDFKQLSEYQHGDSVRHIDWKATLRLGKPVIREFQDERDQCVLVLIDCGRRMRADDRVEGIGTAHFDQVLNAVMLLSYVALKQGDAVGAITFGTPASEQRAVAPRKGAHALSGMMGVLYAIQPTPTHSDFVAAAQDVLRRLHKRALIVIVTNFRDEDADELAQALRLLRSRHLVMLASLRERIVDELIAQPVTHGDAVLDIASAHMYEQSRRDAFNRLAARDALMVDAAPERLGIELVNRYHAAKRAGMI
jgi:uncharacterized protein (DUF58 family)